jgi:hypothetical protein
MLQGLPENDQRIVWAEGEAPKGSGLGRHLLHQAEDLVIFSCPPGPKELVAALTVVKPEKITLFAYSPANDDPDSFLRRLAGLVTFTINRREGRTDIPALASTTAQREATVCAGLDWLSAHGDITYGSVGQNKIVVSRGGAVNPQLQEVAMRRIIILLDETAAYRAYYRRADAAWLLASAIPNSTKPGKERSA